MREKKEHIVIDAFEADIEADYLIWEKPKKQKKYLEKIAAHIGKIIIEFNKLEWQLTEVLKQYFCDNGEELSAIYYDLISSRNFASKVDLLKSFYKVYGNGTKKSVFNSSEELKDWDKQVDQLIEKLKKSAQIRNKYAHCFWHRLEQNKFVEFKSVIDSKKGLQKVFIKFDKQDIKDDLQTISDLEIDLYNIDSIFNEAYTST